MGATCRGLQMHGNTVHLLSYSEQPLYVQQRNLEWNNATRSEMERQHFEIWSRYNKHRTCLAGCVSATVRHSDLMHHNWETRRTQDWGGPTPQRQNMAPGMQHNVSAADTVPMTVRGDGIEGRPTAHEMVRHLEGTWSLDSQAEPGGKEVLDDAMDCNSGAKVHLG